MKKRIGFVLVVAAIVLAGCFSRAPEKTAVDVPFREGRETDASCVHCHGLLDAPTMHPRGSVTIGCTDCHGGDATAYEKEKSHVRPRYPELWPTSANPERLYTGLNREDPAWIRFVNPGDLRVAGVTCGECHPSEVRRVRKSMMAHGAMLWGAALYNNGVVPYKNPRHGEAYAPDGTPLRIRTIDRAVDTARKGQLPFLDPLPRFEIGQPSNILRVFERGGRFPPPLAPGLPNPLQEPGKPDKGLSDRGLGTLNRIDPVWLNLQKTRLLDPLLYLLGTNDHPGDFRSSGCTACHVIYANDRDPAHSAHFARYGNGGHSFSSDPTIPKEERGHPIRHAFTRSIPSSQCIVCHIHPGTTVTNTYLGTLWWDNETDGHHFYPHQQAHPTEKERLDTLAKNPEESAVRGLWSDYEFLKNASRMNDELENVQIADFHGHGWLFRNVYKRDLSGNLLDEHGNVISPTDPKKFKKSVHLKDIHLEKGLHCVDCHFEQDVHGNGHLYGSVRDAIEISCDDCHGSIGQRAQLKTTGPAAPEGGHDLSALRTPFGKRRFARVGEKIVQRSMVTEGLEWEIPQIADGEKRNPKSWLAKTIQRDNKTWGEACDRVAHQPDRMTCFSCHSSWMASCFGCHLPMRANQKTGSLHNDGDTTRNFTPYNWQTIRADTYMLGVDGTVTGNRIAPARSACAVIVGSQNANREWVYSQQQTISAEGFSGIAFSTHVPHTVRKTETKNCTDCHPSKAGDNNALMAQLLMQGSGYNNFMYRWVYVGTEHGLEAFVVTERDEPQAVIGSTLHRDVYRDHWEYHKTWGRVLPQEVDRYFAHASKRAHSVQLRGEYVYTADGPGGLRIFDVAQIDHKGFSERIVTAPVSPLDQRLYVKTKDARWVASPTTLGVDPTRTHLPENEEQDIHMLYAFLYVADYEEGLLMVNAATLLNGNPRDNVLVRPEPFNPKGILKGARYVTVAGRFVYIGCDKGLVVVDVDDPTTPRVVKVFDEVVGVRGVQIQFRYAFVACEEGVVAIDITPEADGSFPKNSKVVSRISLRDARGIYVARTYAYVAGGRDGLVILDISNPAAIRVDQRFTGEGRIRDANDVQLGITNASLFAYIADGRNGLRVVQLTSPERDPKIFGWSPRPDPQLIATGRTQGRAYSVSRGLDRDRAVDEAGNQLAVFNRVGARPFTFAEMQRFFRLPDGTPFAVPAIRTDADVKNHYGKPTTGTR
ncbi:MAG: hypothetical protein ACYTGZ_13005 [Planctomycetota bacterium]|jgi:hypothetical protein